MSNHEGITEPSTRRSKDSMALDEENIKTSSSE
jgi:hypothetical protein